MLILGVSYQYNYIFTKPTPYISTLNPVKVLEFPYSSFVPLVRLQALNHSKLNELLTALKTEPLKIPCEPQHIRIQKQNPEP